MATTRKQEVRTHCCLRSHRFSSDHVGSIPVSNLVGGGVAAVAVVHHFFPGPATPVDSRRPSRRPSPTSRFKGIKGIRRLSTPALPHLERLFFKKNVGCGLQCYRMGGHSELSWFITKTIVYDTIITIITIIINPVK